MVEGVASGALQPEARLPSIRALSKKLVVAPLTVKKAYDELEGQGLIEMRQGQGTFVRAEVVISNESATERLRPLVRRLVLEASLGGIAAKELASLIVAERARLHSERNKREAS